MEQEEKKQVFPSVQGLGRKKEPFNADQPDGLAGTEASCTTSSGHAPHTHMPGFMWSASSSKGTAGLGTPKALCFAEPDQSMYVILPLCCQGNT